MVEIDLKRKYLKEKEVILKILEKGTFLESHVNMLRNQAMSGNFFISQKLFVEEGFCTINVLITKMCSFFLL